MSVHLRSSRENVWAIPWSDLMMVMFILFVVLFATKVAEREVDLVQTPDAAPELPASLEMFELVRSVGFGASPETFDAVRRRDGSIHLRLGGALFFSQGSADLGSDARDLLDRLAPVLAAAKGAVRVIGHTDDSPVQSAAFPTNWELSAARAAAVARHLIQRGSSDPDRFVIEGHGMHAPLHTNAGAWGRALNRRVEIVIDPPATAGRRS